MRELVIGLVIGTCLGGTASALYAHWAIAEYKRAAADVGVFFKTVEGKLAAIRKAL